MVGEKAMGVGSHKDLDSVLCAVWSLRQELPPWTLIFLILHVEILLIRSIF